MVVEGRQERLKADKCTKIEILYHILLDEESHLPRVVVAREADASPGHVKAAADIGKLQGHQATFRFRAGFGGVTGGPAAAISASRFNRCSRSEAVIRARCKISASHSACAALAPLCFDA
jgi:hypothetical protein